MKQRLCRKCQKQIPATIKIDNKVRHLYNRKFCLECSPFGCRNTRSDDPSLPPKKKGGYSTWSDNMKMTHKARVYRRAILRKDKLLEMHGGSCINCGYSKCKRALSFHHKDPSQKLFGLSVNNLWSKPWKLIEEESAKCELLCMNCHAEYEESISIDKGIYRKIIDEKWGNKNDVF